MPTEGFKRKLRAILSADVVGYNHLRDKGINGSLIYCYAKQTDGSGKETKCFTVK